MRNVFKYCGKHTWRHPIMWMKDMCRGMRWAKQRIVRGWADCDTWNMDWWFEDVVSEMLDALADTCGGWPDQLFDTPEEWSEWLHKTAHAIKMMNPDEQDKVNKYWEQYINNWQQPNALEDYFTEAKRIAAEATTNFEEAMAQFTKNFLALWD